MIQAPRPKILIAEDDKDIREMLSFAFSLEAFDVVSVNSAFRMISTLQVDEPVAVILETQLPWGNGIELCESIKKSDDFEHVPVILLSTRRSVDERHLAANAGASDYFTKPFHIETLVSCVQKYIAQAQNQ